MIAPRSNMTMAQVADAIDRPLMLHRGDCLDVLDGMKSWSVDLIFTSPPYERQRSYGIGYGLRGREWAVWCAIMAAVGIILATVSVASISYHPSLAWLWIAGIVVGAAYAIGLILEQMT